MQEEEPQKRKLNAVSNIDIFFEQPKAKRKKTESSTVGQSCKGGGVSYLSTNNEDGNNSTHLMKIEIYDLKKLAKVPINERWKHADVRVKYYVQEKDNKHYRQAKDVIYSITKEIAESGDCKKYHFGS